MVNQVRKLSNDLMRDFALPYPWNMRGGRYILSPGMYCAMKSFSPRSEMTPAEAVCRVNRAWRQVCSKAGPAQPADEGAHVCKESSKLHLVPSFEARCVLGKNITCVKLPSRAQAMMRSSLLEASEWCKGVEFKIEYSRSRFQSRPVGFHVLSMSSSRVLHKGVATWQSPRFALKNGWGMLGEFFCAYTGRVVWLRGALQWR